MGSEPHTGRTPRLLGKNALDMRKEWLFLLAALVLAALWPLPHRAPPVEPLPPPATAFELAMEAGRRIQEGRLETARLLCELALEQDPHCAPAWNNRGWIRYLRGDAVGALADAERAVALDPDDDCALHTRAMAKARLGRLEEARRELYRVLEIRDEPLYRQDLADICRRLGHVEEAEGLHARQTPGSSER